MWVLQGFGVGLSKFLGLGPFGGGGGGGVPA